MDFAAKRIVRTYRQMINAAPDAVFPLLCPVREAEWLDDWHYTMIHSRSGLAEYGAVFSTPGDDNEGDTVWVVSRHDARTRVVEFVYVTPASRVCVIAIQVCENGKDRSFVDITYMYTGLTDKGNSSIEAYTEEQFIQNMMWWEASMNYYLMTGTMLRKK